MYRGRPWTMRQYAGFGTAAESNLRYRYLLDRGVMGLSVAFDLPTQIGYDSDHALARGEVGRVGVAIDSLDDMTALFDGIPLDRVSTSMTINATALILLAMYVAVGRRQGMDAGRLSGTVQNDILKEYVARGTYIFPPRASLRIVTDIVAFCTRTMPQWNPISISGYHIREAGSTATQEVAFTIADGIAYVDACRGVGLDVNAFAPRLRSSSTRTTISSKRSPSSGRRAGSGRGSCATVSARPIRAPSNCAFTHRPPAAP